MEREMEREINGACWMTRNVGTNILMFYLCFADWTVQGTEKIGPQHFLVRFGVDVYLLIDI